jgi:hypothetical protein
MSKPTKCYAVTSGEYSAYEVHAIYRRREDAVARVKTNNDAPRWMIRGVLYEEPPWDSPGGREVQGNPAREEHEDMRVEEFDYYEGEDLPAPLEEDK